MVEWCDASWRLDTHLDDPEHAVRHGGERVGHLAEAVDERVLQIADLSIVQVGQSYLVMMCWIEWNDVGSSGYKEAEMMLPAVDLEIESGSSHVSKAMTALDGDEVAISFDTRSPYGAGERQLPRRSQPRMPPATPWIGMI